MSEKITHRISIEGADPLALAGVNDGNLVALEEGSGARVTLRGEQLTLSGELEAVERASQIATAMVELARLGELLSQEDVRRLIADGVDTSQALNNGDFRIALPGMRKAVQPKSPGQRDYVAALRENEIVIGIGPAGTGKTYLAVAMGVESLTRKRVRRLVLARPAVEAGERLGFLPGDLQAKVDPYLRPLYDALEDMMPFDRIQRALETRMIEIAPLGYMRGRTLQDAFVILDEAQNVTGMQMKMFLTRLGLNSRAVIVGDKTQIDLPQRDESGLIQVERILPGIDGVAFCYLDDRDVVRHRLVREIIRAYAEDQSE
ncbi:MAG: PhoH family protein [Gemmatimonadota bacterium]|nr:PhoH family protein [Gemmatimonadota bacterium]MDH3368097.1 PhoH family protein [Gemmatimonadota bacterium]MDH3478302.1 PhoH family protein [Gemmatimonadota bacterium]MDH3570177.1 PhoH family protein [Gemmatimonadota bacterium]MDH5550585.1 PhoH family protein [Gemmatimonadota bacterium]